MLRALQIGNDSLLMQTRIGLLQAAGLQVQNLHHPGEALDCIPRARWDVAILCHTLTRAERAVVIAALRRRHPRAPILLVARRSYTPPIDASGFHLVLSPNPVKMIAALRGLVQRLSQEEEDEPEEAIT